MICSALQSQSVMDGKMNKTETPLEIISSDEEDYETQAEDSVDKFLMMVPEVDFITTVKLYKLFFDGEFQYFSDVLLLPYGDKVILKHLFEENIFSENFGTSIIKLTSGNNIFLLQPHVWNIIENERELLANVYSEICFRLSETNDSEKPKSNEVLFRYTIPLALNYILAFEYIYDETKNVDQVIVNLKYKNIHQTIETAFKDYDISFPAGSFNDFLTCGPFIGTITTNSCLAVHLPDNFHEKYPTDQFGSELSIDMLSDRKSIIDKVKKELIVKRVYV